MPLSVAQEIAGALDLLVTIGVVQTALLVGILLRCGR